LTGSVTSRPWSTLTVTGVSVLNPASASFPSGVGSGAITNGIGAGFGYGIGKGISWGTNAWAN